MTFRVVYGLLDAYLAVTGDYLSPVIGLFVDPLIECFDLSEFQVSSVVPDSFDLVRFLVDAGLVTRPDLAQWPEIRRHVGSNLVDTFC